MPYTPKIHVVTKEERVNYAERLQLFISVMARQMMMDEIKFRRWIRTERGGRAFEIFAECYDIPLFVCQKGKK